MNLIEEISKRTPTVILFSLVISTLYNAGFLQAAASVDLINNLSYQDIIISTIFIIPVLISLIGIFSGIYKNIYTVADIDAWWKYIIIFLIILSGSSLILISKFAYSSFGWVLIFFGLSPFFGKFINSLNYSIERDTVAILAMLASLCVAAYGSGYSSYSERACFGDTYVTHKNCSDCLLIKSYSGFMILKSMDNVIVVPNDNDLVIKKKTLDMEKALKTVECNPIGVGWSNLNK